MVFDWNVFVRFAKKGEGRSVSEAPFIIDGDKPNSVSRISSSRRSFIFQPQFLNWSWTGLHFRVGRVRRYPEIDGPAVLLLFCLAPHGVFPAARITSRAVSSYLAFSPLPALFSKNRRYHFCDTFRRRNLTNAAPAFFTRHAAVWCSDFPLMSLATHQRSSAIANNLAQRGNP